MFEFLAHRHKRRHLIYNQRCCPAGGRRPSPGPLPIYPPSNSSTVRACFFYHFSREVKSRPLKKQHLRTIALMTTLLPSKRHHIPFFLKHACTRETLLPAPKRFRRRQPTPSKRPRSLDHISCMMGARAHNLSSKVAKVGTLKVANAAGLLVW